MARIVSLLDKAGQRPLFSTVSPAQQRANGVLSSIRQRGRHNHKTDTQRRKQRFAEGAEIDHRGIRHHSQHRRDRFSAMAKLAVVVILHNPRPVPAGIFHERQTRPALMMLPQGYWCEGEVKMSRGGSATPLAIHIPSSSTAIPLTRSPAR